MTVNEAIEILKVAKAECEWNAPLDYQAAFDTVIDYLSEPTEAITEEVVANILLVPTCSNCGQVISDVQVVPNEWYEVTASSKDTEMPSRLEPECCPNCNAKLLHLIYPGRFKHIKIGYDNNGGLQYK